MKESGHPWSHTSRFFLTSRKMLIRVLCRSAGFNDKYGVGFFGNRIIPRLETPVTRIIDTCGNSTQPTDSEGRLVHVIWDEYPEKSLYHEHRLRMRILQWKILQWKESVKDTLAATKGGNDESAQETTSLHEPSFSTIVASPLCSTTAKAMEVVVHLGQGSACFPSQPYSTNPPPSLHSKRNAL